MAAFLLLLREPLRRLIKYLSVPVASIPAGLLYVYLLKVTTHSIAIVIILPLGIASAYVVWSLIDRWLFPYRPRVPEFRLQDTQVETATAYFVPSPYVITGTLAVMIFVAAGSTMRSADNPPMQSPTSGSVLIK